MGFISNLFGGNKEDKALREALALINRIIEDEQFQLEHLNPIMKEMIESAPAYDKDPNGIGPFGFIETNPIPVNGPIGQLAYLSKLETQSGQRRDAPASDSAARSAPAAPSTAPPAPSRPGIPPAASACVGPDLRHHRTSAASEVIPEVRRYCRRQVVSCSDLP